MKYFKLLYLTILCELILFSGILMPYTYISSVRYIGAENSLITFSDSIDGIYINPVSSVYVPYTSDLNIGYSKLNRSLTWLNVIGGIKFKNIGIGLGMVNQSASDLNRIDNNGVIIGDSTFYHREYILNGALKLNNLLLGCNIKSITYKFDYYSKKLLTIEPGSILFLKKNWFIGVVGKNFSLDNPIIIYALGKSFNTKRPEGLNSMFKSSDNEYGDSELEEIIEENKNTFFSLPPKNKINIELDLHQNLTDYSFDYLSTGIEWWLIESICLRSGFSYNIKYKNITFASGITIIIKRFKIEYAYKNTDIFGSHFFNLGILF